MITEKIRLVNPIAPELTDLERLNPRISSLKGKTLGVYDSRLWANFALFARHLVSAIQEQELGITNVVWMEGHAPGTGHRLQRRFSTTVTSEEWDSFASKIDTAIVGLGA